MLLAFGGSEGCRHVYEAFFYVFLSREGELCKEAVFMMAVFYRLHLSLCDKRRVTHVVLPSYLFLFCFFLSPLGIPP